jgi:hypothetical protein
MGFQALYAIGYGIDKVMQKFGKPLETITDTQITAALSEVQNTTPPAPGSATSSSSSEHTPYGKYKPEPSDLAYLLHDGDEGEPPNYIVTDLKEYGTKCIPLKVYVSVLLRTWETALLIYLPFLYNNTQPNYSQTLILEISPFLLEKRKKMLGNFEATTLNSDLPHDFAGNIDQFFNFIKLFIYLKKKNKGISITGIARESLNQIPDNFTIILVAGNDKVYLRVVDSEKIEYYLPPNIPATTLNPNPITIPDKTIQNINSKIVNSIVTPSDSNLNNKYESYDDKRFTSQTSLALPRTIYSTFPVRSYAGVDFTNFENIGKYGPDIFSFLKWVIEFKSHPKNTPILFVSHSKTMNEFLKMMISNHSYNYTNTPNNVVYFPTDKFVDVCEEARETNTWSMRFKYLGYNVTGFRHAQSCDNMYKTLDEATSKMDKAKKYGSYVATLGVAKGKELSDRNKLGKYTNLSLWGIFSTLIFIHSNKGIISDFANVEIKKSGLMILSGMGQQSKDNIEKFGTDNELTCGDVTSRFLVSGAGAGAANYTPIQNFVDIVPYSIPLYKMDITARQRMSNELCCLNNIFKIEFDDCEEDGCKIKVTYDGPSSLTDVDLAVLKGQNSQQREEILKKIQNIMKRSVNINIYTDITNKVVLTLQNVNPGGLVTSASGKQEIKSFFKRKFGTDEETMVDFAELKQNPIDKIKISDAFQKSVAFLMGVDIFNTDALTYDALYNSFILYSNLLIRQLLTTHLLVTSYQNKNRLTFFNETRNDTTTFLKKDTSMLYGGKKNKKSKHKQNKNK